MKKTKITDKIILGIALGMLGLNAHSSGKGGTSGAAFLTIGAGARPVAMGEAFTAMADDVHSLAWNPAGLGRVTSPEFTASRAQWLQTADHNFVAGALPTRLGTFALGFTSLMVGDIEKRTGDTDVPDGTFDASDAAYQLAWGTHLNPAWTLGAGGGMVRRSLDGASASALMGQVGLQWQPLRRLRFGVAVRNLGSSIKFKEESDPLPLTTSFGVSSAWGQRLVLSADIRQIRDEDLQYGLGGEWKQPLTRGVTTALRAGYSTASTDVSSGLTGVTFGVGVVWKDLGFDMAYVPYGDLGNTFRYSLVVKFGSGAEKTKKTSRVPAKKTNSPARRAK